MKFISHPENGELDGYEFMIVYDEVDDLVSTHRRAKMWCSENCQGQWLVQRVWETQHWAPDIQIGDLVQTRVTLSSGDDAMRFKLTFA